MSEWEKWEEDVTESSFWFAYIVIWLVFLVAVWALFQWVLA